MPQDNFALIRERQAKDAAKPIPIYPTKAEVKRCRRRIVSTESYVQTYRVYQKLECGHEYSITISGAKHKAGFRGPQTRECYQCAQALAEKERGPK